MPSRIVVPLVGTWIEISGTSYWGGGGWGVVPLEGTWIEMAV